MSFSRSKLTSALVAISLASTRAFDVVPLRSSSSSFMMSPATHLAASTTTTLQMSMEDAPEPTSFRESEVLGLRYMQDGNFEQALSTFQAGMKLPGSRKDVVRNKSLSGPSPVGGSFGGTDSTLVMTLDDFELQAAHYNMACAHAQLGNVKDAIENLEKAFMNGFDNLSTVRGDPDLNAIKNDPDFERLMKDYEKKGGFNPFGFLGK